MISFKTFSLFWLFVVTSLSAFPQRSRTDLSNLKIPRITLDGRRDCNVTQFLESQNVPYPCNMVLPRSVDNYFVASTATLCFGVYDTLYELCKHTTLDTFEMPHYQITLFCKQANQSTEAYNFVHGHDVFSSWVPHLKRVLTDASNCTELCLHGSQVNPFCSIIVAALQRLATIATIQPKPAEVTQSLRAVSGKSSTPLVVEKPRTPTKAEAPSVVPVSDVKSQPSLPDAPRAPPVKTEEVPKPPAEKTLPLTEDNAKPEQSVKPEMKPAVEPNDPQEQDAQMIDMEGPEEEAMQDDVVQSQQPETPVSQRVDANVPPKDAGGPKLSPEDENLVAILPNGGQEDTQPQFLPASDNNEETNMVTYFVLMTGGALLFYVAFHNKNKLLALALEGRRTGRRGGRHSASYSKLHSNLEETIAAGSTSPTATHVLY